MSESVVISGKENVEHARWLAVRSALKLEIMGLSRRGRSARQLANEITGKSHKTREKAYEELNAFIVASFGSDFDKPLDPSWRGRHG